MILYGGINKFKNILGDVACYDIIAQKWRDVKIVPNSLNRWIKDNDSYVNFESDEGPGPLYHHKCAPVFYPQRNDFWDRFIFSYNGNEDSDDEILDPLIKMPEIEWQKVNHYIKQEGIYFFGGKSKLDVVTNEVWCLKP